MPRWALLLILGAVVATLLCSAMFVAADEGADGAASGAGDAVVAEEPAEPAQQEFPVIVVHKDVSAGNTIPGKAVTVTVTVLNIGSASAFNVQLSDKAPFEGDQTASAAELEPGKNITHVYTVTPQSIGHTALPIAEVSYTTSKDAAEKLKAVSNEVREEVRDERAAPTMEVGERGFINVVTQEDLDRLNATHWLEYVMYFAFCAIAIAFPFMQSKAKTAEIVELLRKMRARNKK